MAFEVTRDLPLEEIEVQTPVAKAKAKMISGKTVGIIPILRAGPRDGKRDPETCTGRKSRAYRIV